MIYLIIYLVGFIIAYIALKSQRDINNQRDPNWEDVAIVFFFSIFS